MKPSIIYNSWNPFENFELDFDIPVSISVDTFEHDETAKVKILILYLGEPTQTLPYITIDQNVLNKFDKIYTHNPDLLNRFPQAEFLAFGSCWINFEDFKPNKQNHISFVTSSKSFTDGHRLRNQIYKYLDHIDQINEFEIYQHKSPPYHSRRNDFFETSKFHIAVENCREKNYFSEKLIDCFASKTIPIYCGCPNIGEFFNLRGMIIFKTLEELKDKLNNLSSKDYDDMLPFVEENMRLSELYYGENCITKRLQSRILTSISSNK